MNGNGFSRHWFIGSENENGFTRRFVSSEVIMRMDFLDIVLSGVRMRMAFLDDLFHRK